MSGPDGAPRRAPDGAAPDGAAPDGAAPDGAAPDGAASRVLRNVGALTLARGATMAMTLATTAVVARAVEPAGLGTLGFGLALVGYFSVVGTLGLDVLGTREVARRPAAVRSLVSEIVSLRLALGALALALYALAVWAVPRGPAFKAVLLVQGLVLVGQAISLEWVYQGTERMGVIAVRNVAAGVFQLAATVVLVRGPGDIVWAAAAQVGAVAVVGGGLVVSYRRDYGPLALRADWARWRALVRESAPFAASVLMIAVYFQIDKIMLGVLRTDAEVGLYEAAYRVVVLAGVPVQVLSQAFFPGLAAAVGRPDVMRASTDRYVLANTGLGFPVAAGGALLAGPLVALVAGPAYAAAAVPLTVLMASAAVTCLNMGFGQPLLAWDRQRVYLAVVGAGAVANVALNAFLIPAYGPTGAAWATLGAEAVAGVGAAGAYARMARTLHTAAVLRAAVAAAVGVGGGILGARAAGFPWPVQALFAVLGYAAAAVAAGVVRPADLRRGRL